MFDDFFEQFNVDGDVSMDDCDETDISIPESNSFCVLEVGVSAIVQNIYVLLIDSFNNFLHES